MGTLKYTGEFRSEYILETPTGQRLFLERRQPSSRGKNTTFYRLSSMGPTHWELRFYDAESNILSPGSFHKNTGSNKDTYYQNEDFARLNGIFTALTEKIPELSSPKCSPKD